MLEARASSFNDRTIKNKECKIKTNKINKKIKAVIKAVKKLFGCYKYLLS
jgi:hypothetical protein